MAAMVSAAGKRAKLEVPGLVHLGREAGRESSQEVPFDVLALGVRGRTHPDLDAVAAGPAPKVDPVDGGVVPDGTADGCHERVQPETLPVQLGAAAATGAPARAGPAAAQRHREHPAADVLLVLPHRGDPVPEEKVVRLVLQLRHARDVVHHTRNSTHGIGKMLLG